MSSFDEEHTTSYTTVIESERLSRTVLETEPVICRKSPILTHPPASGAPAGVPRLNFAETFGIRKLDSLCYRVVFSA